MSGSSTTREPSKEQRKARIDRWLYGGAAALAVAGALFAFATREQEPEAQRLDRLRGADELRSPASRGAGPTEAPDLPEVPTLSARQNTLERRPAGAGEADSSEGAEVGAEMRLLAAARREMREQPAEALDLLEQHRRRHPRGLLREEREVLAIEALARLRRNDEAERRYLEFLDDFPRSELRGGLSELLRRLDARDRLSHEERSEDGDSPDQQ